MQRYIVVENLRRFRALLETERSPEKRHVLQALVHEEEAKLRSLDGTASDTHPEDRGPDAK